MFSAEQLARGYRLACQAYPLSDVKVEVPPESLATPQRLSIEGQEIAVEIDPVVTSYEVHLPPPNLEDLRSDATRLQQALSELGVDGVRLPLTVLHQISERLRALDWRAQAVVREGEVVAILPLESRLLGLAVDIGTTKLAAYLLNLTDGETLAKAGEMNPQISYGEDVISRIAYCDQHPDGRQILRNRVVETLNRMIEGLCAEAGEIPEHVVEAVIVGNTAMHHLFAGLPVHQLGMAPYVPAVGEALDIPAHELGLHLAPGAYVHLPPNIAGYVGADHVAMAVATEVWQADKTMVALDIGTNTEITLAVEGRLLTCSCASGPAFEGAHIRDGMRAAPGAIERVQISRDEVRIFTIGNQPPVGICGSGILDAVAEMLNVGLIDNRGVFTGQHPKVAQQNGQSAFVLTPSEGTGQGKEVIVNRRDIHEIQLAKSAIRSGIEVLLEHAGITPDQVEGFIVAGAFGTYLNLESAIRIGMFLDLPRERFRQVGNAAGTGARQMLVSGKRRDVARDLVRRVEYIELTTHRDFQEVFMKALYF